MICKFIIASCVALTIPCAAFAQQPPPRLTWPTLTACQTTAHPVLPPKWRGIFLMMPYSKVVAAGSSISIADIVYDNSLPAMKLTVKGPSHGGTFFVQGQTTYQLTYDDGRLAKCESMGDTGLRPLPRDLLPSNAVCAGSLPVSETAVNWWKIPASVSPATNWIWYKRSDNTPFRLMFNAVDDTLPPFSWWSFAYQYSFETETETDLGAISAFCRAAPARAAGTGRIALQRLLDGSLASTLTAAERAATRNELKRLAPEVDLTCSSSPPLPKWPATLGMSSVMTSVNFANAPWPTQVLYKWSAQSQRTTMLKSLSPKLLGEEALLLQGQGYDIYADPASCTADLPGTPYPDWPTRSPCSCQAVINGKTPLTPYGTTQILSCPMIDPRVFWTWYTLEGRPVVFMETGSPATEGTGLALADYYDWIPNYSFSNSVFDKPSICPAAPTPRTAAQHRQLSHRAVSGGALPPQCFTCHMGSSDVR